jgi:hypothetical protein
MTDDRQISDMEMEDVEMWGSLWVWVWDVGCGRGEVGGGGGGGGG